MAEKLASKLGVLGEFAPVIYNLVVIAEAKGEKTAPARRSRNIPIPNAIRKKLADVLLRLAIIEIRNSELKKAEWYANFASSL